MSEPLKFDKLNTSFVNLAAFIRHLREKLFKGRLHLELEQYEGDIFFYGADAPSTWEIDRTTGREEQGDAAMQRLLVRAREPGGVITVFDSDEKERTSDEVGNGSLIPEPAVKQPEKEIDATALLAVAGELIAAVERAAASIGADFNGAFHTARVELGDDYPFIDPTSGSFEYEAGVLKLDSATQPAMIVKGVSSALKKVVDSLARETDGNRIRELVAVEFAVTAGGVPDGLGEFTAQLDRIAGTRVL
jgi:hypothetical protein